MENYVVSGKKSVLKSYRHTLYASYLGYITQAIVNNFVPPSFYHIYCLLRDFP